ALLPARPAPHGRLRRHPDRRRRRLIVPLPTQVGPARPAHQKVPNSGKREFSGEGAQDLRAPNMRRPRFASLALLTTALCLVSAPSRAEDLAAFYRGRQISWILSADAGGGYAAYARAFAPYLTEHLPGKPNIVIQHMPGGGGLRAMGFLFSVAPRDGTTIGLVHSSVPFAPLYGIRGAACDPGKMGWIGSIATSRGICVAWHTAGIASWQDMLSKEFIVGGSGAGSQMETLPALLNRLFGTHIKVISGYK